MLAKKNFSSIIFIFSIGLYLPSAASPLDPNGITTSLSEKGFNFGIIKNTFKKKQFNIGITYFDSKFLPFDIKYNNERNLQFRNIGLNIGFKRFLTGDWLSSRIYMGFNGEVLSTSLKSKINMANESYKSGNLTFTCSACGNLLIETDPGKLVFIPSFTLGYEKKIRQNLKADIGLGFQYINLPAIVWSIDNNYKLPSHVSSRVDNWVADLNNFKDSIPKFMPTLKFGLSYIF